MIDSKDKLIALLNLNNLPPKDFTENNIRFSAPEVYEGPNGINTQLTVTGVPGRGYAGSVDIYYRRLPLSNAIGNPVIASTTGFTVESILAGVNNAFGLFLDTEDFEPFEIPALKLNESAKLTLQTRSDSLGWVGRLEIELQYNRPDLLQVVGIRALPILKHPVKVGQFQSARMLTWGLDFTSLQELIKPNYKGRYEDFDALQAACAKLGLPAWTNGLVGDYATSLVGDSNPLFKRVVIQPTILSGAMAGQLYFHYNPL